MKTTKKKRKAGKKPKATIDLAARASAIRTAGHLRRIFKRLDALETKLAIREQCEVAAIARDGFNPASEKPTKKPCEHPSLEYTPDPSGNNDCLWRCQRCGGEWDRNPNKAKPSPGDFGARQGETGKTLRGVAQSLVPMASDRNCTTKREQDFALRACAAILRHEAKGLSPSYASDSMHSLADRCDREAQ